MNYETKISSKKYLTLCAIESSLNFLFVFYVYKIVLPTSFFRVAIIRVVWAQVIIRVHHYIIHRKYLPRRV